MITEIVSFALPPDLTREQVVDLFERSVPRWQSEPALIRKQYLYDPENNRGGGVYLWKDIESARAAHDETWCDMAADLYGSRPSFDYFETPIVVDNAANAVLT